MFNYSHRYKEAGESTKYLVSGTHWVSQKGLHQSNYNPRVGTHCIIAPLLETLFNKGNISDRWSIYVCPCESISSAHKYKNHADLNRHQVLDRFPRSRLFAPEWLKTELHSGLAFMKREEPLGSMSSENTTQRVKRLDESSTKQVSWAGFDDKMKVRQNSTKKELPQSQEKEDYKVTRGVLRLTSLVWTCCTFMIQAHTPDQCNTTSQTRITVSAASTTHGLGWLIYEQRKHISEIKRHLLHWLKVYINHQASKMKTAYANMRRMLAHDFKR